MRKLVYLAAMLPLLAGCGGEEKKDNSGESSVEIIKPVDTTSTQATAPAMDVDRYPDAPSDAYTKETIKVASFEELYRNIGNNRTLEITVPEIKIPASYKGDNLNVEVNLGLKVTGISNLKIVGKGTRKVRLTQPDPMAMVISFFKCDNIHLENIEAGHSPEKGSCAATVLNTEQTKHVFVENCVLYGSGYEGITTFQCTDINLRKSTIHGCSFQMFSISQSQDVRFFNCFFTRNREPNGSGHGYIAKSKQVVFNNCQFADNAAYMGQQGTKPLLELEESEQIYLKGGIIRNNKAKSLTNSPKDLKVMDVNMERNSWQAGS